MGSVNLMRKGPEKLRDADWRSRRVRIRGQDCEIQNKLFVGYFSILILFEGGTVGFCSKKPEIKSNERSKAGAL